MQNRIEYEALVQKALLNVIRDILADVAVNGLPGEHHFYISFSTRKAGVQISERLKERFPETMTIVLQHRFWDMQLFADSFTVTLSFGGVEEKLLIPFAALQVFYDPVAAFEVAFSGPAQDKDAPIAEKPQDRGEAVVAFPPQHQAGGKSAAEKQERNFLSALPPGQNFAAAGAKERQPAAAGWPETAPEESKGERPPHDPAENQPENPASAHIVSLDAFRKK